jgi:hypothetical protein
MWRLLVTSIYVPIDEYYLQKEKKNTSSKPKGKGFGIKHGTYVLVYLITLLHYWRRHTDKSKEETSWNKIWGWWAEAYTACLMCHPC